MYQRTVLSGVKVVKAIMASGIIIEVDLSNFLLILQKAQNPLLVVSSNKGFWGKVRHQYLTSYRNFVFFVETEQPIELPPDIELIEVEKAYIPRI